VVVTILERDTTTVVPDSPADLFGRFSDRALVGIAAASLPSVAAPRDTRERLEWLRHAGLSPAGDRERRWHGFGLAEGPQLLVEVSPGTVRFRRQDWARLERRTQGIGATARTTDGLAAEEGRVATSDALAAASAAYRDENGEPECRGRARIRSWSAKSRANMAYTLNALDYAPILEHGGAPAMLTLTYPGDWLEVAPSAAVCQGHLRALRKRYQRRWGRPMVGLWKREFQARGAPHFHILMVPPGAGFERWLAETWVDVVDAASCGLDEPFTVRGRVMCCDRHRHLAAHLHETVVDRREGSRYTDPRRVGAYFAKHGLFAAKDYQNDAPDEWDPDEGIGRFWGVWGLSKAVVGVQVAPEGYEAMRRTVRRYQRAMQHRSTVGFATLEGTESRRQVETPHTVRVPVWRKVTTIDRETGELGWKWRKRHTTKRLNLRLKGRGGFLAVNDGPGFVLALSRQVTGEGRSSFAQWSQAAGP